MTTITHKNTEYRIQPMLPISIAAFGGRCDRAAFSTWESQKHSKTQQSLLERKGTRQH